MTHTHGPRACRCVFRINETADANQIPQFIATIHGIEREKTSLPYGYVVGRPNLTPRLASRREKMRPLPLGVTPKVDLAELHRACRSFLTWWSQEQAFLQMALQLEHEEAIPEHGMSGREGFTEAQSNAATEEVADQAVSCSHVPAALAEEVLPPPASSKLAETVLPKSIEIQAADRHASEVPASSDPADLQLIREQDATQPVRHGQETTTCADQSSHPTAPSLEQAEAPLVAESIRRLQDQDQDHGGACLTPEQKRRQAHIAAISEAAATEEEGEGPAQDACDVKKMAAASTDPAPALSLQQSVQARLAAVLGDDRSPRRGAKRASTAAPPAVAHTAQHLTPPQARVQAAIRPKPAPTVPGSVARLTQLKAMLAEGEPLDMGLFLEVIRCMMHDDES